MTDSSSPFPLESVSERHLQKVCQILWAWHICVGCETGSPCSSAECLWPRSKQLARYFEYYKGITSTYVPELLPGSHRGLRGHDDLLEIVQMLKANPDVPRSELEHKYFSERDGASVTPPSPVDQHRAFNLAVRVMMMVNCSTNLRSPDLLELGSMPFPWRTDTTLGQFIMMAFPKTDHPSLNYKDPSSQDLDFRSALTATNLKKAAGLRFQSTDDLRNHLKLDHKRGIVQIYHHTAFLKEHLLAFQSARRTLSTSDAIKLGNLPRQIALETLDSLQNILFPADEKSQSLLRSLVSKASFDQDCLRYESAFYRSEFEDEIAYQYFGSRLMDLYDELENPTPRGLFQEWIERRSGARYVMMATMIGVIIAVILGVLGLGVSIFQTWIGYQQWRHPVPNV